mgnify:CR=1 FL=1
MRYGRLFMTISLNHPGAPTKKRNTRSWKTEAHRHEATAYAVYRRSLWMIPTAFLLGVLLGAWGW